MQVSLNVYDVTNTANENTNGVITRLNSITRELNLGGVFHGAVQLEDVEWSFGYCENGTGVYCCRAQSNGLYTFREHIELGLTGKTKQEIKEILTRFKRTWPGTSYDLLQRNCCHFCEELCAALGVPSPPAWLNRFAQGADATVKFTNEASALAKRVGSNISTTAQQSAVWLRELSLRVLSQISQPTDDDADITGGSGATDGVCSGAASPLYARSLPPPGSGSGSELPGFAGLIRQPEGGSMGRLASRLRQFGGAAGSGTGPWDGGGGGGGLPASTPASCCDLMAAAREGGRPPSASPSPQLGEQPRAQVSGGPSLPIALPQKWRELEAAAGDGTKQFLFGLIKTRQARLNEEEASLAAGGGNSGGGGYDDPPGSSSWTARPSPGGSPPRASCEPEPIQAPAQRFTADCLLPLDVVGCPAVAAAAGAATAGSAPLQGTGQDALQTALGAEWPLGKAAPRGPAAQGAVAAAAAAAGAATAQPGRVVLPSAQHLLDM